MHKYFSSSDTQDIQFHGISIILTDSADRLWSKMIP